MANLGVAVDAYTTVFVFGSPVTVPGGYPARYTVGSEVVHVTGGSGTRYLSVDRGVDDTVAAPHAVNAAFTSAPAGTSGSGGVTNDAPAGSVAVSDGADLTGSPNLTWDEDGRKLGLAADENDAAYVAALGLGSELQIKAGDGDATHVGGEMSLTTGNSDGNNGGDFTLTTGSDSGGGDSGAITIQTGQADDGDSGDISIKAGGYGESAVGGRVLIQGGTGQTGNGGHVTLQAGNKITGGSHVSIRLFSANGTHSLELQEALGFLFSGGVIVLDGLPSSDPLNAGQLYSDGVPSAGVPKALKISGG